MKSLAVFATLPAPPATAAWLRARLDPVVEVCRFARPIPLEIRPTGKWGGWCGGANSYADGRVCISSAVVFWSRDRLLEAYLHEAGHRLLDGREVASHGPEFFAMTAILYTRANQFFEGEALHFLSLYDLHDVPEAGKGHALNWALALAKELAPIDRSAEELASVVCLAWAQKVKEREAKKLQIEREKVSLINLKLEVINLNMKLLLWRALCAIGWAGMVSTVYLSIVR